MFCFPKSRINENGGRNSKLLAIITAVKMLVFINCRRSNVYLYKKSHSLLHCDRSIIVRCDERRSDVGTYVTNRIKPVTGVLSKTAAALRERCTTSFLRNYFYFPGIGCLDWTYGHGSTTRRLSDTQHSCPKLSLSLSFVVNMSLWYANESSAVPRYEPTLIR